MILLLELKLVCIPCWPTFYPLSFTVLLLRSANSVVLIALNPDVYCLCDEPPHSCLDLSESNNGCHNPPDLMQDPVMIPKTQLPAEKTVGC